MVEVDASDVGVGPSCTSILPWTLKMHPCAAFSHRLNAMERNYDVRKQELLAVKMELEERRHWLEEVERPFIVWTDHKNLEYLHRQASELQVSSKGPAVHPVQLYYLLPPGVQEC